MNKTILMTAAAMVASVGFAGSANAQIASTSFTPNSTVSSSMTSGPVSPTAGYAVVQSFDTNCSSSACAGMSGSYQIYTGNIPGYGAVPYAGDATPYLAILGGQSATYTLANPTTSIQFDWGTASIDNVLTLFTMTGGVAGSTNYTVAGSDIPNGANYNTNGLFTATASAGSTITGLKFAAGSNSFEVDNIAAAVPEPATWGMMILGFGLMGAALRRRKQASVSFA